MEEPKPHSNEIVLKVTNISGYPNQPKTEYTNEPMDLELELCSNMVNQIMKDSVTVKVRLEDGSGYMAKEICLKVTEQVNCVSKCFYQEENGYESTGIDVLAPDVIRVIMNKDNLEMIGNIMLTIKHVITGDVTPHMNLVTIYRTIEPLKYHSMVMDNELWNEHNHVMAKLQINQDYEEDEGAESIKG